MQRTPIVGLFLLMVAGSAMGQRMSFAPEAFLKDVDSVSAQPVQNIASCLLR